VSASPDESLHRDVAIARVRGESASGDVDALAVEAPLEIRVEAPDDAGGRRHRSIVVLRTPGHDLELAAGLLFAEGVIHDRAELDWIEPGDEASTISVGLHGDAGRLPEERTTFISSGCGACGKAMLADLAVRRRHRIDAGRPRLTPSIIHRLPETLREHQAAFTRTGGLHAAGLFDEHGAFLSVREDVGRHNALDKLIGRELLDGRLPLEGRVILVSGRAGFELVQKAAMAGVPVLASVGAPSSLAVEIATGCGMTLLGFVRDDRFNIYADVRRIERSDHSRSPRHAEAASS